MFVFVHIDKSSTTANPLTDVKFTSTTTIRNNLTNLPESSTTTTSTRIPTTNKTTTNFNKNTETTTQQMFVTTTSRSSNGTTNDYGPNKGPRVGDNNITESTVPKVPEAITTEMPPDFYTEHMVNFHVDDFSPSTEPGMSMETTTMAIDDGATTKGPKVRYDVTSDYDEATTPTIFTAEPYPVENTTATHAKGTDTAVLPIQCNNVNDCAPNERCINNKCTKICDTTNSNRSSVDCVQGICK